MKKTIILDFDGVLHSYEAWKGIVPTDPPTEGAREAVAKLREQFRVVVLSTRCTEPEGVQGIKDWLAERDIEVDAVVTEKQKAVLMVDDRGYRFDGDWDKLLDFVKDGTAPEPWNRSEEEGQEFYSMHVVAGVDHEFRTRREVYLLGPQFAGGNKFVIAHIYPEAVTDAVALGGPIKLPKPVKNFLDWCAQNTVVPKNLVEPEKKD